MWTETKIQEEMIENHKFCDVCGAEIRIGLACSAAYCMYCRKDLCENCIGHENSTMVDYRDVYCKQCWELGKQYRPIIEELHLKIESLYKEWQDKCKLKGATASVS